MLIFQGKNVNLNQELNPEPLALQTSVLPLCHTDLSTKTA